MADKYNQDKPGKLTRKGIIPQTAKIPKKGTGRNKPSKFYDPITGLWNQSRKGE